MKTNRINKIIAVMLLAVLSSCNNHKPSSSYNSTPSTPPVTTTTPISTSNSSSPDQVTSIEYPDDGLMHSKNNKVYPIGTKNNPFSKGVCTSLDIYFIEMQKQYGDSLLIKCGTINKEDDFTMLVDVGDVGDGTNRVRPFIAEYADNEIDFAVFTHGHADHINGFKNTINGNVDNVKIKTILDFGYKYETKSYTTYYETYRDQYVNEKKSNYCTIDDAVNNRVCPSTFHLANDLTYTVYDTGHYIKDPSKVIKNAGANDTSIVGILKYKDFSFFLSGDLDQELDLLRLNPDLPSVNLMKAGHHGSDTSNSPALLKVLKPENIIISAAAVAIKKPNTTNDYYTDGRANDHPNPIALKNMFNSTAGQNVYTNLTMGTVHVNVNVEDSSYSIKGMGAKRLTYEDNAIDQSLEKDARFVDTYFYNNVIITKYNKTLKDMVENGI